MEMIPERVKKVRDETWEERVPEDAKEHAGRRFAMQRVGEGAAEIVRDEHAARMPTGPGVEATGHPVEARDAGA